MDASGNDRYEVRAPTCRALGAAHLSEWGRAPEDFLNLGVFVDRGGADFYPEHCADSANNAVWSSQLGGTAVGMDGEFKTSGTLRAGRATRQRKTP